MKLPDRFKRPFAVETNTGSSIVIDASRQPVCIVDRGLGNNGNDDGVIAQAIAAALNRAVIERVK